MAKRLIDASKIIYHKSGFPKGDGSDSRLDWAFREDIDNLPTVDAVEVVRCRDCKWDKPDKLLCKHWCTRFVGCMEMREDDFCSYGERKEG